MCVFARFLTAFLSQVQFFTVRLIISISLITSKCIIQCIVNVNVTFRQSYQNAVTVGTSQ